MIVIDLPSATFNMAVAMACGALIGSERQVRQRMAGLRTNALVAMGASSFVIFSQLFANEVSPTRVAAQVVSGIGFLGAGIIYRDGLNVKGLNTAATLWCSAAVGLMAGASAWPFAVVLTLMVVFVNLGLRPLVKFLKKHTKAGASLARSYHVSIDCKTADEVAIRALLLRSFGLNGFSLVDMSVSHQTDATKLLFTVQAELGETAIEQTMTRIAAEAGVIGLSWTSVEEA
ncbi:MAG: MgtC/SapB family protein [Microgenomates group bacterium]